MIKVIAVGKMKNKDLQSLCADYFSRLSHFCRFEMTELKDSTLQAESSKMLEALAGFRGKVYALGEEGNMYTSVKFSKKISDDEARGGSAFVIGSAYGLAPEVKARADEILALSPMTFTHEFARAILAEQLYRARTIIANTGYHHI